MDGMTKLLLHWIGVDGVEGKKKCGWQLFELLREDGIWIDALAVKPCG